MLNVKILIFMNAVQSLDTSKSPRLIKRRRQRQRSNSHQVVAVEITTKLLVNGILSLAAIVALVKLLPYQLLQQEKLHEVRVKVEETEIRVNSLRENFSRNFDPSQSKNVMQEQSSRVDPNRRRVFWLNYSKSQKSNEL